MKKLEYFSLVDEKRVLDAKIYVLHEEYNSLVFQVNPEKVMENNIQLQKKYSDRCKEVVTTLNEAREYILKETLMTWINEYHNRDNY